MKISKQITGRMEELAAAESEAAFRSYCDQALATVGPISADDKAAITPLARQAFEKGITSTRLGEIIAQSKS